MTGGKTASGWPGAESPFHAAERAIHARYGFADRAEQAGRRMIRAAMPDQHRELFAELPFVIAGSLDTMGRPWASLLIGARGFVSSPDAHTLDIAAHPLPDDPLGASLVPGRPLGLLGIQLETRRRNRANGRVSATREQGFSLHVEQSFGNCPKYITPRVPCFQDGTAGPPTAPKRTEGARLSTEALACIAACDTCFIASATAQASQVNAQPRDGVDVSHRGGVRGFVTVRVEGDATTLILPDYAGNNMFNTFGNLMDYPRAGLLFVDFSRGTLLQLTGETQIVWSGPEVEALQGAQRALIFYVREGRSYETSSAPPPPCA